MIWDSDDRPIGVNVYGGVVRAWGNPPRFNSTMTASWVIGGSAEITFSAGVPASFVSVVRAFRARHPQYR
jgi:hypothetical protein